MEGIPRDRSATAPRLADGMAAAGTRRQWLAAAGRLGLGVLAGATALGTLSGCETAAPATNADGFDPQAGGLALGTQPAAGVRIVPEAEGLFAPHGFGDVIEGRWRLLRVEQGEDGHLTVHMTDVRHGGPLELELFRGPGDTRPLARTERWEMFSYDGSRGETRLPEHVYDVAGQIALLLADNESRPELVALAERVCRFTDRKPPEGRAPPADPVHVHHGA